MVTCPLRKVSHKTCANIDPWVSKPLSPAEELCSNSFDVLDFVRTQSPSRECLEEEWEEESLNGHDFPPRK
ncbi:hypothetical protein QJS10_CPB13g00566 [Acorus calamus]|uniref:Uncharacterized protein n=1 Tax=Acorus calamus TaxID=4465 RepID=A0AAV9DKV0_ACOCL|nr:hypothetical protein QJS10_CPB13g00566 [Acorus calamus]